ncbi:MAG: DUF1592 domain-containing protein [Acidobacteriota bacterium]
MQRRTFAAVATACVGVHLVAVAAQVPVRSALVAQPPPAAQAPVPAAAAAGDAATIKQYCVTCHNDRARAGGLTLAAYDPARATDDVATTEKIIRKLRAGMMPPAGARRPDAPVLASLAASLETRVDRAAAASPDPGFRPFQRLNRAEYARAVHDLLALDVDVTALLPPDTISHGFDNVADAQTFSPTLLEGYLRAASRVAALALGDPEAEASETRYRVPKTASQLRRVDGAPFGTRGGLSTLHTFPADGEYVFRLDLHSNACGFLFGPNEGEQVEVSIDGERKALLDINPRMAENTTGLTLKTDPIRVTAGAHRVTAAFLQRFEGPVNDLVAPIDHTLADTQIGVAFGITTLPHLKDFTIVGPYRVTGVSDTPSRRRVFTCRPTRPEEETPCATAIVDRLGAQAFRRPLTADEAAGLMKFYRAGREEGDFEYAVGAALEAILASPQFVFRLERAPAAARADAAYRLGGFALASRLSYFLWGAGPDAELLAAAERGELATPAGIDREVRRMLADPRSEALATRFASQWLRLHDVDAVLPDAVAYPYFDRTLGDAFRRETELFFDSLVREDRSILDLLTADHTFVNERIARHYGIPNVMGNAFRRVTVPDERRGLLGHGSVLVLTSVADRTSPVMRGKWVMEVLLGSPPPPPPPNVPPLEETGAASAGKLLSVRERMEEHRRNPACTSCHRVIDPIGLALENFDVTGRWRIRDNGVPIDASGELYDGTRMDGPAGLRRALLKHQDAVLLSFTEHLLTYALGRRVEPGDMPTVRRIIRDAAADSYRISSFIVGVARSPAFRMNRAAAVSSSSQGER